MLLGAQIWENYSLKYITGPWLQLQTLNCSFLTVPEIFLLHQKLPFRPLWRHLPFWVATIWSAIRFKSLRPWELSLRPPLGSFSITGIQKCINQKSNPGSRLNLFKRECGYKFKQMMYSIWACISGVQIAYSWFAGFFITIPVERHYQTTQNSVVWKVRLNDETCSFTWWNGKSGIFSSPIWTHLSP